jgi:hypothetical protein
MPILNTDLIWLAGILDGEGSLITYGGPGKSGYHPWRVDITNTDPKILQECQRILTESGVFFVVSSRKNNLGKRVVSVIEINRHKSVLKLVSLIRPFVRSSRFVEKVDVCIAALTEKIALSPGRYKEAV